MSDADNEFEEDNYTGDDRLDKALADVMAAKPVNPVIRDFRVRALFAKAKRPLDREAGVCRCLDEAKRIATDLDFLVVIWKTRWDAMTSQERHRLIVHQVLHMGVNSKGDPRMRGHAGDFCGIWEHDKETETLATQIPPSSALAKFPRQATMKEVAT